MNNDEYHSLPSVSNSKLSVLIEDPRLYWWRYLSGQYRPERKDHFDFGSAVHDIALGANERTITLIPDDVLASNGARSGGKWKQFLAEHEGEVLLKKQDYDAVMRCVDAIHKDAAAGPLLARGGHTEVMFEYEDAGRDLTLRCKPDRLSETLVLDLKTTSSSTSRAEQFVKSVSQYGYHRQEYFYRKVLANNDVQVTNFIFIVVSTSEPHTVDCFTLDDEFLRLAEVQVENALSELSERMRNNEWRAKSAGRVVQLSPQNWLKYQGEYEVA